VEQPSEDFYRFHMGGSLLALTYLLREIPSGIDPLSEENVLVLASSVVTGAPISGLSRLTAAAKSPLTGAVGDSQGGGFFPAALKFSGFDAVVIKGQSPQPVILYLHDGEAELRPAKHLWGKTTRDVETLIAQELGKNKVEVLQCGPAGEKLVRFASLMNRSSRANGRTGMGAVMGSKRLRAIAATGRERPKLADPKALKELAAWGVDNLEESGTYGLGLLGTASSIRYQNADGGLPTRNWASGTFAGWEALDGVTMAATILKDRDTCFSCIIRCKRVVEATDGAYRLDPGYGGPEYESLAALGSYCGVGDLEAVAYANQICNTYAMDTISCGATIAWAMDCYEQGIITQADTGGIDLRFGNAEAMVQMAKRIAKREGFGDLLAEGSARAAAEIGHGADELLTTVKGQELPAHMPQVKRSLGLIYAVNPFGADHESSEHDPSYRGYPERMRQIGLTDPQPDRVLNEEKIRFALTTQYLYSCTDTLNACQFVYGSSFQLYNIQQLADVVSAVTGWEVNIDELKRVGQRRLNMLRAFNACEGFNREDDTLPKKLFQPLSGGASHGLSLTEAEIEEAKDLYYEMAGWDVRTGTPTRKTLEELGLAWVADKLHL
ncbi:MAG: aldehyde ferredoxin oxidoreductase family protein, partial [Anaerolineales bacterium]|nr:aldehyde ferredoxin oxidoreductase family protein [Anaerolineales bacterium]